MAYIHLIKRLCLLMESGSSWFTTAMSGITILDLSMFAAKGKRVVGMREAMSTLSDEDWWFE